MILQTLQLISIVKKKKNLRTVFRSTGHRFNWKGKRNFSLYFGNLIRNVHESDNFTPSLWYCGHWWLWLCSSDVLILNLNGANSIIRLEKIQNIACFSFSSDHLLFPVFSIMVICSFVFLTVLGLCCCTGFSLGAFLYFAVRGLLVVLASVVVEHRL